MDSIPTDEVLWGTQLDLQKRFSTVLTGVSDPELVCGFHSSHAVMCVLIH